MKLCMGCMNEIEDNLTTCPLCGFNESTLRQESYYLDPGTIVGGRYIVGRVINYNGHNISYLGMDAQDNKKVVVKEYLPSDFSTRSQGEKEVTIYSGDAQEQFEHGLSNFLNESSRIQSLGQAEGVAQVYDCIPENDTGYVISQYIEGHTLKEVLESGKKYNVSEAKAIIVQILTGLSKLHPMDVIHCDIAPENIMLAEDGSVKLLNFGATRYVTTANSKSLAIILKQGYAPEEQYRSKGVRGPWTDVYAVAAVMYRMITGITPQESVERTLVDELKAPSKLGIDIPVSTENALMNALNVYQEERTASAGVFLQELNSDSVKRIKVKKSKVETGKFPTWAKVMVASLLCIVVAGGGILYFMMNRDTSATVASTDISIIDYKDMDIKDATDAIDQLNKNLKEKNVDCQLKVVKQPQYDGDVTKEDKVLSQSISAGTNLSSNFSGEQEIILTYSQSKSITYKELSQYNAFQLAKKMKTNLKDKRFSTIDEFTNDSGIFGISSIELTDNSSVSRDAFCDEKQADDKIDIKDIKSIYYLNQYCILENVTAEKYVGRNINDVSDISIHSKLNEEMEQDPKTKKLSEIKELYDDSFYSFEYGENMICDVDMEEVKDGTVDTSDGSGIGENKLFKVVGAKKSFAIDQFASGGKLRDALIAAGLNGDNITISGGGESEEIIGVDVVENGTNACFTQDAKITIKTRKKIVTTPSNSSSGGNGGGTNSQPATTAPPAEPEQTDPIYLH